MVKQQRAMLVFTVVLLCVSLLVGCSGGQQSGGTSKPATPAAPQTKEYKINIATATTGGVYYPLGNALAQIWSKNLPGVKASAQSTAGTPQNIELMKAKEADVAFGQNGIAYYAYFGQGTYEGKPVKTIRGMLALYPNVMHMVVRKGAGIKSVADLKNKRFVPGQVGSATEINGREILGVYGLNYQKEKGEVNVKADFVGYNEAADLLKDGHTDAILIAGGLPTSSVMDVLASGKAELIPIEPDKIKEITQKYPWYFEITIPKGTYSNQTQDIKTVAVSNILMVREDLDEELVYKLTKATYDYHNDLVAAHKAAKDTTLEHAMDGMTIPVHPGAAKYFKEKGIKVPDIK